MRGNNLQFFGEKKIHRSGFRDKLLWNSQIKRIKDYLRINCLHKAEQTTAATELKKVQSDPTIRLEAMLDLPLQQPW
jgi:hypothetical protein